MKAMVEENLVGTEKAVIVAVWGEGRVANNVLGDERQGYGRNQ